MKWNAGHTKYKFTYPSQAQGSEALLFDENTQKIMNNALVPVKTGPNGNMQRDDEVILQGQDYDRHLDTLYRAKDDKKKNTFALKMVGDLKNNSSPSKKLI